MDWLVRKSTEGGFAIMEVRGADNVPDALQREPGIVRGMREGSRVTVEGVVFEGRLRITDAERFCEALLTGLGRGKAYGFGLLSVAPV